MKTTTTLMAVLFTAFAISHAAGQAPTPSATILWRVDGTESNEHLGTTVRQYADVNGDGTIDVLSQANAADTGFLDDNGSIQMRSGTDGSLIWRIDGTFDDQHWGLIVENLGDLDGDGVVDLIVVEPAFDSPGLVDNGRLTALRGQDGSVIWTLEGTVDDERLGTPRRFVSDVNGDGVTDFLTGSGGASTNGLAKNGFVQLLSPRDGTVIWRTDGTVTGEMLGSDVAAPVDINGDGRRDAMSTSTNASVSGLFKNGVLQAFDITNGTPLWRLEGTTDFFFLSEKMEPVPDINNDGVKDILVGTPLANTNGLFANGWGGVVSGIDGTLLWTIHGTSNNENLGRNFAQTDDLDGDGVADAFVGIPGHDSNGLTDNGQIQALSLKTGAQIWSVDGSLNFGKLGRNLKTTDDVDGDGFQEAFSAHDLADTFGRSDNGVVMLHSGLTGALLWRRDGAASGDHLGALFAFPGDLDGDGLGDIVVSSPDADPAAVQNSGRVTALNVLNGIPLWEATGSVVDEHLGGVLESAESDMDLDGFNDVLAYGVFADTNGLVDNGSVKLISGATGKFLWRLDGDQTNTFLGRNHKLAQDEDFDGFRDLFLGAKQADSNGLSDNGYILVVSAGMGIHLQASGLVSGGLGTFTVQNAAPGSTVFLLYSLEGPGPSRIKGRLVPLSQPVNLLGTPVVQPDGTAVFSVPIPPSAAGRRIWVQGVQKGASPVRSTNMMMEVIG